MKDQRKVAKEIRVNEEDRLSKLIIESAIEVHKILGEPGLLESVYEGALTWELTQ